MTFYWWNTYKTNVMRMQKQDFSFGRYNLIRAYGFLVIEVGLLGPSITSRSPPTQKNIETQHMGKQAFFEKDSPHDIVFYGYLVFTRRRP
jgi:hypothetical protein